MTLRRLSDIIGRKSGCSKSEIIVFTSFNEEKTVICDFFYVCKSILRENQNYEGTHISKSQKQKDVIIIVGSILFERRCMLKKDSFIMKGNIIYMKSRSELVTVDKGYLVCLNGLVEDTYKELPEIYKYLPLTDYGDDLVIPGLVDMHTHAPQYTFVGLGMDMELIDWLNRNTFPEESKYADREYARRAYEIFCRDLLAGATTRACIYATVHKEATLDLMDMLEQTGLKCMVGKVNMDRNCPDFLKEATSKSIDDTVDWLRACQGRYQNITPVITPRFVPTCTDELLKELGRIQKEYKVPLQSHLSENFSEIEWVKELCPDTNNYGEAYDKFGLFGENGTAVMAHCVHSTEEEIALMKAKGVFIAHCPDSNTNLASGIAPVRKFMDLDMRVGLGTDMAGGNSNSIFRTMVSAIQVSKLRWRLKDSTLKPLTAKEAFYLGTMGGGALFGKVGSFLPGYELDALIIDDSDIQSQKELTLEERLERIIYLSDDRHIKGKYIAGKRISAG